MNNPNKKRLRRTMMFLNAQKPGLIKDPYIYKADSLMLDLEDAVAENQKDVARFSLYHALKTVDYRGAERVVRINGLDTPYWREDIRATNTNLTKHYHTAYHWLIQCCRRNCNQCRKRKIACHTNALHILIINNIIFGRCTDLS